MTGRYDFFYLLHSRWTTRDRRRQKVDPSRLMCLYGWTCWHLSRWNCWPSEKCWFPIWATNLSCRTVAAVLRSRSRFEPSFDVGRVAVGETPGASAIALASNVIVLPFGVPLSDITGCCCRLNYQFLHDSAAMPQQIEIVEFRSRYYAVTYGLLKFAFGFYSLLHYLISQVYSLVSSTTILCLVVLGAFQYILLRYAVRLL